MNPSRLRDFAVLCIGGLIVFGVVTFVTYYAKGDDEVDSSNHSPARRLADMSLKREDWENVKTGNQRLIELDPFNGHAWFNKGNAEFQQMLIKRRRYLRTMNRGNKTEEELEKLKEDFLSTAKVALDTFKGCLDFARYRNRSRAQLAYIYICLDNSELALNNLEDAVNDGYYNKRYGLQAFQSLESSPRFEYIKEKESENRVGSFDGIRPSVNTTGR